jgi:hypothetical protein
MTGGAILGVTAGVTAGVPTGVGVILNKKPSVLERSLTLTRRRLAGREGTVNRVENLP